MSERTTRRLYASIRIACSGYGWTEPRGTEGRWRSLATPSTRFAPVSGSTGAPRGPGEHAASNGQVVLRRRVRQLETDHQVEVHRWHSQREELSSTNHEVAVQFGEHLAGSVAVFLS